MRPLGLRSMLLLLTLLLAGAHAQVGAGAVSVEALTARVEVDPRTAVHLVARFLNTTPGPVDVDPRWSLPDGWRWVVPPTSLRLAPGEGANSVVSLLAPASAPAGPNRVELRIDGSAEPVVFEVVVRSHRQLQLRVLDAPELVVLAPYALSFLVVNDGNIDEGVQLTLRHDARFGVRADVETLWLPAGGSEVVTVTVTPPARLAAGMRHTIRLSATSIEPGLSSRASSTTVILPLAQQAAPMHHYDMRLRWFAGARLGADGKPAWSAGATSPGVELRGRGTLDPEGVHHLDFLARVGLVDHDSRLTIRYRSSGWDLVAGHQSVRLTPLLSLGSGFGARLQVEQPLDEAWMASANVAVLSTGDGTALGADLGLHLSDRLALGLTVAQPSAGPVALGVRFRLRSDLGPDLVSMLDVEAVHRGASDPGLPSSMTTRLALGLDAGPVGISARWTQSGLGTDAGMHSDLHLGLNLVVPRASLSATPWRSVQYAAWLRHRLGPAPTAAVPWPLEWGLSAGFHGAKADTTFRYAERHGSLPEELRLHDLRVRLRLPWADGLDLDTRLRWSHVAGERWGALSTRLAGTLRLRSADGGSLGSLGLAVDFGPDRAHPRLTVEGDWRFSVNEQLRLRSELGLAIDPRWSARMALGADLDLAGGQALELRLTTRLRPEGGATWQGHLAWSIPIALPLGPAGPSGVIEGRVTDQEGVAIAGVQLRLGDHVAFSDAQGLYRFAAVALGEHRLTLFPPASHADRFIHTDAPSLLSVKDGETVAADFRLLRPASVAVGVVFETGVSGAPPALGGLRLTAVGSRRSQSGTTDAQGHLRFDGLEPGSYRIELDPRQVPLGYRLVTTGLVVEAVSAEVVRVELVLRSLADARRVEDGGVLRPGGPGEGD